MASPDSARTALLVLDMQNDFLRADGALPVVNEPDLVPAVAALRSRYGDAFQVLVHTQDWHPRDHISFTTQHPGVPILTTIHLPRWTQLVVPDHCVQG